MESTGRSGTATASDEKDSVGDLKTNPPGMSSSDASSTTALERRRKSRRDMPESRRAEGRATSRRRMAVYRARKKAEKSAQLLKLRLDDEERAAVEERSARRRKEILADWFRSQKVSFDRRIRFTKEVLESFMSKVEIHRVELLVAEYEIAIITGVCVGGDAVDDRSGSLGDGNHEAPSVATANSKRCIANALQGRQKQGGSIGTRGLAEANSTIARAFCRGNDRALSTTTGEEDRGKSLEKCAAADSTSTHACISSSYQDRLEGETMHHLSSQISGDGDCASAGPPNSARTQVFAPRLSDEQVNDFLSCFGGALAEESAPADSSSRDLRAFGDSNVQALPNHDERDRFFSNVRTVEGEGLPAIPPANEEESAGPARAFGESDVRDAAPSSTGADTITSASSRSIFGEGGPDPARPFKTAGICGEGVAPEGGGGGDALSRKSDSDSFDMESLGVSLGLEGECADSDMLQW